MIEIAKKIKPETVTLVPEKREEVTTEGGLRLSFELEPQIKELKETGIELSVFIEPDLEMIELAKKIGADAVEIHTGKYANLTCQGDINTEVERILKAAELINKLKMRVVAGHGLNYHNTQRLVKLAIIEEFNIGHSIISRAIFTGLAEAVFSMKEIVSKS